MRHTSLLRFWLVAFLMLGAGSTWVTEAGEKNLLEWDVTNNRVRADIQSMKLVPLLERISEATGWRIFLEPGTERTVSTSFSDRRTDKALDLLLGDLNRVLLPPTNGASRLLIFRTQRSRATHKIRDSKEQARRRTAVPIPNELIIRVQPGTDVEELARQLGAKVVGYIRELDAYRLRFDDAALADAARELLALNDDVLGVENNYRTYRDLPSQSLSGGAPLQLIPKKVPEDGQIVVGLIDTTVDNLHSGISDFLLPEISVVEKVEHPGREPLHGDSIAQTILRGVELMTQDPSGTAVRILPVDVYGYSPETTTFDVAVGVYQAINQGADIINLSLGSDGTSPILEQVIQSGYDQGVLFFAAAGNEPGTAVSYPAGYDGAVMAVTARNRDGSIAYYANSGQFVDISAPGVSRIFYGGQSWQVGGTSVSTGYASGAAAALLESSGMDPRRVEQTLRQRMAVTPASPVP